MAWCSPHPLPPREDLCAQRLALLSPSPGHLIPPFFSSFLGDHLVQTSYIKDGGTEVQKAAQLAPSHLAS